MDKQEFLNILKHTLQNEMPAQELSGHMEYYRNYIEEQERAGRSEGEILSMLGDPRLIARTILDTFSYQQPNGTEYYYEPEAGKAQPVRREHKSLPTIVKVAIGLAIVWFVLRVLTFLIPIVLPVVVLLVLLSYLRKR